MAWSLWATLLRLAGGGGDASAGAAAGGGASACVTDGSTPSGRTTRSTLTIDVRAATGGCVSGVGASCRAGGASAGGSRKRARRLPSPSERDCMHREFRQRPLDEQQRLPVVLVGNSRARSVDGAAGSADDSIGVGGCGGGADGAEGRADGGYGASARAGRRAAAHTAAAAAAEAPAPACAAQAAAAAAAAAEPIHTPRWCEVAAPAPASRHALFARPASRYMRARAPRDGPPLEPIRFMPSAGDTSWLVSYNSARAHGSVAGARRSVRAQAGAERTAPARVEPLDALLFDTLMDSLERLAHERALPATERASARAPTPRGCGVSTRADEPREGAGCPDALSGVPEDECAVCTALSGAHASRTPLRECASCRVRVHADCYVGRGAPAAGAGGALARWLCEACTSAPDELGPPQCVLCPRPGGALKSAGGNRWAHVTCALCVPEAGFLDASRLERVIGVEAIGAARWALACAVCGTSSGAALGCAAPGCRAALHVGCAQAARIPIVMPPPSKPGRGAPEPTCAVRCPRHSAHAADGSRAQPEWHAAGVGLADLVSLFPDEPRQHLAAVYEHWLDRRRSARGKPLLADDTVGAQ